MAENKETLARRLTADRRVKERRDPRSVGAPYRGADQRSHGRRLADRDVGNARNVERDLRVSGQMSGYSTNAIDRGKIVSAPIQRRPLKPLSKPVAGGFLKGMAKRATVLGLGYGAYKLYKEAKTTIGGDGNK